MGLPDPERRIRSYPHELSGGQQQRVMIAIALACEPALLIADEPTTALDVTVEAQILDLLRRMQRDHGTALLLITHDMAVVAEMADRVVVMYAGQVVEQGPVREVLRSPYNPYTRALIDSIPMPTTPRNRPMPAISGSCPPPRSCRPAAGSIPAAPRRSGGAAARCPRCSRSAWDGRAGAGCTRPPARRPPPSEARCVVPASTTNGATPGESPPGQGGSQRAALAEGGSDHRMSDHVTTTAAGNGALATGQQARPSRTGSSRRSCSRRATW